MEKIVNLTMPIPGPLALLEASLTFIYEVLMAQHPELFAPPGTCVLPPSPGENNAKRVIDAVHNLQLALESYCDELTMGPGGASSIDDDIPF